VAGVIKSLGFSQGVVVGHDWGGMAAWATLAYAAGPVRALVSVAAPHPLAFPWRANLPTLAFFQVPLLPERRIRPVRVPLLSAHGQEDRLVPLTAMTAAERWLEARHDVVSLPGVGHLPHEEAPDAVTQEILDWLPAGSSGPASGP
jgi:pimeloyl-ACP methyl ester carboxylesterase